MKKICVLVLMAVSVLSLSGQTAWTVESLPNPKTTDNTYVCNPDNILDATMVRYLNTLLQSLEDSTTTQVAVVIVNSIGDAVPEQFRYDLFNYWGVGQKEKDNGLLILMVLDQRRVEFETGYGLEGILTDAMCKDIQMEYMVPLAKEERYGDAVMAGVQQVIRILMDPNYRQEVFDYSLSMYDTRPWYRKTMNNVWMSILGAIYALFAYTGLSSRKNKLKKAPAYVKNQINNTYLAGKFAVLNLGLPIGFYAWQEMLGSVRVFEFLLFAYGLFMILLLEKRFRLNRYIFKDTKGDEPQDVYNVLSKSHSNGWLAASIFFPLPFIFYSMFNKRRMNGLRNAAPVADDGTPMVKLNEAGDDEFLKSYQLTEENIHSADYDVWRDMKSGAVRIFRFENFNSKYKDCPKCHTKSYLMTKNVTVTSPTYDSTGVGRKTYLCSACQFTKSETYTIAKLTRSSSGSGGGGFSGGGGGGFGGGGSGGGGAGSGW